MKILKIIFIGTVLFATLTGCGFFDDAKELARQLEYYKKYARTLEEKVKSMSVLIDSLRGENSKLKNELQKYQEAHKRMLQ